MEDHFLRDFILYFKSIQKIEINQYSIQTQFHNELEKDYYEKIASKNLTRKMHHNSVIFLLIILYWSIFEIYIYTTYIKGKNPQK